MAFNKFIFFLVLAVLEIGAAHLPSYLKFVPEAQRKEFQAIRLNPNLTIAEIETAESEYATSHGFGINYNVTQANINSSIQSFETLVGDFIVTVQAINTNFTSILNNKNQTLEELRQALIAVHSAHPIEAETLAEIGETIDPQVIVIPFEEEQEVVHNQTKIVQKHRGEQPKKHAPLKPKKQNKGQVKHKKNEIKHKSH